MKIIKRDPFREIEEFFNDQDFWGFMPALKRNLLPPMDIYQTDNKFVVELQVPKINPDNLNVSIDDRVLKIEYEQKEEEEKKGRDYYRKEIRTGSFSRAIGLPANVKEEGLEADLENGLLKITIPKEKKESKKVEVKVK